MLKTDHPINQHPNTRNVLKPISVIGFWTQLSIFRRPVQGILTMYSIHPKAGPVREVEWSSRTQTKSDFGMLKTGFKPVFRPKAGPDIFLRLAYTVLS
jgi:hypothetical protein